MTDDEICSACGAQIEDEEISCQSPLGIIHYFGYGSEYDFERLSMTLCMSCADKLVPILQSFCGCGEGGLLREYRLAGGGCNPLLLPDEDEP